MKRTVVLKNYLTTARGCRKSFVVAMAVRGLLFFFLMFSFAAHSQNERKNLSRQWWFAAYHGLTGLAQELLDQGVDINLTGAYGRTALMEVAKTRAGLSPYIDFLIERGADLELRDSSGQTALMIAAGAGSHRKLKSLLLGGAKVNAVDFFGRSALMLASLARERETFDELLFAAGVLVDLQDDRGQSALIIAAMKGLLGNVKKLLAFGADVSLADAEGNKALYHSLRNGNFGAFEMILLSEKHDSKELEEVAYLAALNLFPHEMGVILPRLHSQLSAVDFKQSIIRVSQRLKRDESKFFLLEMVGALGNEGDLDQ